MGSAAAQVPPLSSALACGERAPVRVHFAEKAVMANAMKPVRQGMQQEAPHELVGRQGHHLALIGVSDIRGKEFDIAPGAQGERPAT